MSSNFAIIILTWNHLDHVRRCLKGLSLQSCQNFEKYLICNQPNNTFKSDLKKIKHEFDGIFFNEKNLGFAKAYNEAISAIDNKYVILLNDDTFPGLDWFSEVSKNLIRHPKCLIGSNTYYLSNPKLINHQGIILTPIGLGLDRNIGQLDEDKTIPNKLIKALGVSGAALGIDRRLFIKLGGFDEDFFMYFEDVDFCWRATLLGYQSYIPLKAILYHYAGGTLRENDDPKKLFLCQKNRLECALKNWSVTHMLKSIILSLIYDTFKVLIFLKRANFPAIKAIIKAYLNTALSIKKIFFKRKAIQSLRVISDQQIINSSFYLSFLQTIREYLRKSSPIKE